MTETHKTYNYRIFPQGFFKITPAQKKAFFSALICGFITHLYQMTNLLGNDDILGITPEHYFTATTIEGLFGAANTGRWLLRPIEQLIYWFRTPVTSGICILLSLALTAALIVKFLRIESPIGAILTGALLAVFPTTMGYFSLQSASYPISVLLITMAVCVAERGKWGWLLGAVLAGLALSIFPVNIAFGLMLILLWVLSLFLTAPTLTKENSLWPIVKYAGVIIGGGVFLLASTAFFMSVLSIQPSEYQGASEALSTNIFSNFLERIYWICAKTFTLGYDKFQVVPTFRWVLIGCYAAVAGFSAYLFFANKQHKRVSRWVGIGACVLALPLSLNTIVFISTGFAQRSQHRMQWVLVFVGVIMLGELVLRRLQENKTPRSNKAAKGVLFSTYALISLMVYSSFLFCNIGYYNQQYVMEKDFNLLTRVLCNLEQIEDFSYDKPVYFLSILEKGDEETSNSPLRYDTKLYQNINPDTETNLWAYGDISFKRSIEAYFGLILPELPEEVADNIEESDLREQYADLKAGEYAIVEDEANGVYVVVVKSIIPLSVYHSH